MTTHGKCAFCDCDETISLAGIIGLFLLAGILAAALSRC